MFPALVALVILAPSRAHVEPLERGLYMVGGGLAGGTINGSGTFIGRLMVGYVWHDNAVVGIDAAHSFVGAPTGRVSAAGQYYFGNDSVRAMVGLLLGALNTHGVTAFGVGVELGLPIMFTNRLALVPEVMLETNFFAHQNAMDASVASLGLNLRFWF